MIVENRKCPMCFNKQMIAQGCIPWAREGFVIVKDAAAATKVLYRFAATRAKKWENHTPKASCVYSAIKSPTPSTGTIGIPPPYTGGIETVPATAAPAQAPSPNSCDAFTSDSDNNFAL